MSINQSALRKNSAQKLLDKVKGATENKSFAKEEDPNFWKPKLDKANNASVIFRFLPAKHEDGVPFVKKYSHGFHDGTRSKWFIEECPTTLGYDHKCPVCEMNQQLWNSGSESNKQLARDRKRKEKFVANILIIREPLAPENEGKVFKYEFGRQIFAKLQAQMSPPEGAMDDNGNELQPVDPFSFWDGHFKFEQRVKDKYPSFETSSFVRSGALYDGDEARLMAVLEQLHDLPEPKESDYKDYATLKKRLNLVMGVSEAPKEDFSDEEDFVPAKEVKRAESVKAKPAAKVESTLDSADDEDLAFFKGLSDDIDDDIPF